MPPNALSRIGFGRILGQEMQRDPPVILSQVLAHGLIVMENGVVTDDVDLAVATEPRPQVLQVSNEERRVAPLCREPLGEDECACAPVQGSRHVAFLVDARGQDRRLLSTHHPHGADLGVQVDVRFVLEHGDLALRQIDQQSPNSRQFGLSLGVHRRQHGARPTPHQAGSVQASAYSLRADRHCAEFPQQDHNRTAAPAAAQETKIAGCPVEHPTEHQSAPGAIRFPATRLADERLDATGVESVFRKSIRARAAKRHSTDHAPRIAFVQQQIDVRAAAHVRVRMPAMAIQQHPLALRRPKLDNLSHGLVSCRTRAEFHTPSPTAKPFYISRGSIWDILDGVGTSHERFVRERSMKMFSSGGSESMVRCRHLSRQTRYTF